MTITVSGSSITFPDSTTQTTAFTGGGGVTSLNGQTGAITNTSKNAIGSYVIAYPTGRNTNNTVYTVGTSTVSGTILGAYINNTGGNYYCVTGNATGGYRFTDVAPAMANNSTLTNLGLTGTWRAMNQSRNYYTVFGKDTGDTPIAINFWVRIS